MSAWKLEGRLMMVLGVEYCRSMRSSLMSNRAGAWDGPSERGLDGMY